MSEKIDQEQANQLYDAFRLVAIKVGNFITPLMEEATADVPNSMAKMAKDLRLV